MSRTSCHHCGAALTEYDSKSVQCPHCGGYFESQMPGTAPGSQPRPRVMPARPVTSARGSSRSGRGSSRSGSGMGSGWIIVVAAVIGVKACIFMASRPAPPPTPTIDFDPSFRIPPSVPPLRDPLIFSEDEDEFLEFDNERIRRLTEEIMRRHMQEIEELENRPDGLPGEGLLDEGLLDAEIDEPVNQ